MTDGRHDLPGDGPALQQALSYLRALRETPRCLGSGLDSMEAALADARNRGFRFTEKDLRQAYAIDFRMRYAVLGLSGQ